MTPYQNQDFYMPDSNEEAKKSSGQEIFKKSIPSSNNRLNESVEDVFKNLHEDLRGSTGQIYPRSSNSKESRISKR